MTVGTVFTIMPIPPEPELTRYFTAGVLSFGVEIRKVDDAAVTEFFADITPEQQAELDANKPPDLDDGGISIHVCDSRTGEEHLRFDCFKGDPHYHYITASEGHQEIIKFDTVAHGDMLPWALNRLEDRLPEMLRRAGATALVDALDPDQVRGAVSDVRSACREAGAR